MTPASHAQPPLQASGTPGVHVVAVGQVPAQPWRNGGGQTRELLAWPANGGDWTLRVSVAEIESDGPFSAFPGVQRWFAVLQGAGVLLDLPGGTVRLTPGSPPCGFDGAAAPGCRLIAGPTRDLNLMSRHGAGRAALWRADGSQPLPPGARWRGVFCTAPVALAQGGDTAQIIPALALAWSDTCKQPWHLGPLQEPAAAWWLTLHDH